MKRFLIRIPLMLLLMQLYGAATAQDTVRHLPISTGRTSTLVFPYAVISADRGSKEVLVQKISAAKNVLKVKAAIPGFSPTNLTVITEGGELFEFSVQYEPDPRQTVFRLQTLSPGHRSVKLRGSPLNTADLKSLCVKALHAEKNINVRSKSNRISAALDGIYIAGDVLFFRVALMNRSPLGYDLSSLRFIVSDSRAGRRTAVQKRELRPQYVYPGNKASVRPDSAVHLVFALEKFTLADKKRLSLNITERGGERNLRLRVRNKHIIRATPLNR